MRRFAIFLALCIACAAAAAGAVSAAPPVIQQVRIDRGMVINSWGMTFYHQRIDVTVSATDPETVACVAIDDPFGHHWVISVCAGGGWPEWDGWWHESEVVTIGEMKWWVWEDADHTVHCGLDNIDLVAPPPAGAYTISVSNNYDANVVDLATPPAPAIPAAHPTIVSPAPDSIVDDVTPTLQWTNGTPGVTNRLFVREEGGTAFTDWSVNDAGQIWDAEVGSDTQATYNFDASALRSALDPGRSYFWRVESWSPDDDFVTDPRVSIWTSQIAQGRFTINTTWPDLPELAGKLCYGGPMWGTGDYDPDSDSMWLYSPNLAGRKWLGPETAGPGDWSPDGVRLLYHPDDKGAWIDPGDGSLPYRIPGIDPWGDTRWSPDATQLVYMEMTQDGLSPYEIRIANIDGTNVRAIANGGPSGISVNSPAWSPRGDWIAYRDQGNPGGYGTWLIRPDGTDLHPLVPTALEGYPTYTDIILVDPNWSPDGGRLAVYFAASDGVNELDGIGVISSGGGAVKPVFVGPPGYLCCASPGTPVWSPTGTKIVFTSSHHLPLDPDWVNGRFEPGAELWLINADGSGEPTRLTYDHMWECAGSWWAPPTFADVARGFWALSAINACNEAGIVSGYYDGTYKPILPVTRDQMAVFLVRALGQEPTGPVTPQAWKDAYGYDPAEPTTWAVDFTDVPASGWGDPAGPYWAWYHIQRLYETGVTQGVTPTEYGPAQEVLRDQMAAFLIRALGQECANPCVNTTCWPYDPSEPGTWAHDFADIPATGQDTCHGAYWAWYHIQALYETGVTLGCGDGTNYCPVDSVRRDEMAVFLARAFQLPM